MVKLFKRKGRKKRAPVPNETGSAPLQAQAGNELQEYKARLSRNRKKNLIRTLVVIGIVAVAVCLLLFLVQRRKYNSYRVVATSEQEDTVSTKYTELGGNLLKYSGESASLLNKDQETLWNVTYD